MGIFDKLSKRLSGRTIRTGIKMYRLDNPGAAFMNAIQVTLQNKEGWTPGSWRLCEPQIRRVWELKGEDVAVRAASWLDDQVVANYLERKRLYRSIGVSPAAGEADFRREEELAQLDGREAELIRRSLETLPLHRF